MSPFVPRVRTFRGNLSVEAPVEAVFPLFSPVGERLWVPDWDPELLFPPGAEWEEGQIFRTREETAEAIWVVSRLDRARHRVEYHRVEPGRYVARIEVRCDPAGDRRTEVATTYAFVGLSDDGNRRIDSMTPREYETKMERWAGWIGRHLSDPDRSGRD